MTARIVPGAPRHANLSAFSFTEIGARRRRRAAVAFFTGVAMFAASAAAMVTQGALARGPAQALFSTFVSGDTLYNSGSLVQMPLGPSDTPDAKRKRHTTNAAANFSSRRPVCVRLCDGFFFPASTPAVSSEVEQESSCASVCPDAPVALYYQPGGSDRIEDAISATGARYSALPVALRYRSTQDNTCTCHRSIANNFDPLGDTTLRKGDAVMTAGGFLVFRGDEHATHTRRDFTALAAAPLSKERRVALQALERVSMAAQRGPNRYGVASASPAPIAILASQNTNVIRFVEGPVARTN